MDAITREILCRKDFMLRNYLQWNDELTDQLRKQLVINDTNMEQIQKTKGNTNKTRILLDRIKCKGNQKELVTFATLLEKTRDSFTPYWYNSWISDEFFQELLLEQSALEIDGNIARECATIVHREFGHTKRLSEAEKKTLVEIIKHRTQLTKNIWKKRVETVKADIDLERNSLEWKDDRAKTIGEESIEFIKKNRLRLSEGQVNLTRKTSKAVLFEDTGAGQREPLVVLKAAIADVRGILGASLLTAEVLDKDRIRVLRNMGLSDEQIAQTLLDEEIRLALERNEKRIAEADKRIANREGEYEWLLMEIESHRRQHEKMVENKEKNLRILQSEVDRANEKADGIEQEIKDITKQLKIAKLELGEWVDWYQSIDHGKRLNDIYQRDLPKLKGKLTVEEDEDVGENETNVSTAANSKTKLQTPRCTSPRGKRLKPLQTSQAMAQRPKFK